MSRRHHSTGRRPVTHSHNPRDETPCAQSAHLTCSSRLIYFLTSTRFCPPSSSIFASSVPRNIPLMSQSGRQDLERGNDTSMFSTRRSAMTSLSSRIYVADGRPQPIQNPPLWSNQGGINYGDMSWPLYSMYSKVAQEGDNKLAERFQKAADGLLVLVSPHFTPQFFASLNRKS